ncbi:uncharacterized protein LOC134256380 [Saccostrea cucullata]|uniref:uncharacterized protein LOC134256380 n=1 Tax=Saccostrea cuccullata TaxID=36930 RepID=UPI002ED2B53E
MVFQEMSPRETISSFLLWYFIDCTSSLLSCGELSMETMKIVASCPSNEDEKNKLAKDKNCERYWKIFKHNCTEDPSTFQYHCVINGHRNKKIEVCAKKSSISGYCTEFSILGRKIKGNYGYDCTKFNPPCKINYNSTDAYLYKQCYNFSSEQGKVVVDGAGQFGAHIKIGVPVQLPVVEVFNTV